LSATGAALEAVTFDFWNTLVWEAPDGLVGARMKVLMGILDEYGVAVDEVRLRECHAVAFGRYEESWKANQQYCVPDAVDTMLAELGVDDGALRDDLIAGFSEAGKSADLHLADGIGACLEQLAQAGVRLGIICDIGLTPSPVLRWHLEQRGLLQLFASTVFSDETGLYKPDPGAFDVALHELRASPERAAHVGDRTRTDVAGAIGAGMTAVRYRGVFDDAAPEPAAHHVIDDFRDLPALVLRGAES
jgi:FMN phosphatase YigB (HAD superfamily)